MPKIVEILGPSGIGKTSLYKSLQDQWKSNDVWAVYHDFRYKRKPKRTFPEDYIQAVARRLKKPDKEETHIAYKDFKPSQKPREREFYRAFPRFTERVLDLVHQHKKNGYTGTDQRFLTLFFMMETMEHLQAVMERTNDPRICLMDEGLLSRMMHLSSPTFGEEALADYLENIPVPHAVIYLDLPAEIVAERIAKRKRTATLHQGMGSDLILPSTQKTQQLMEAALKIINNKGAAVYRIDAEKSVPDLANEVRKILEKEGRAG